MEDYSMTDLEKTQFIRVKILEGMTKRQAWHEFRRQVRSENMPELMPKCDTPAISYTVK